MLVGIDGTHSVQIRSPKDPKDSPTHYYSFIGEIRFPDGAVLPEGMMIMNGTIMKVVKADDPIELPTTK